MSSRDVGKRGVALLLAGLTLSAGAGVLADRAMAPALMERLQAGADAAIRAEGGRGVRASFADVAGELTRHPVLSGGEGLSDAVRAKVALAVDDVPGVGGVHWAPGRHTAKAAADADAMLACQTRVEAMLSARSIRFAENSAAIDPTSGELLDEVAQALRPCAGSVIAITGHTDAKGKEPANLDLSRERALAVRNALGARGIDMAGLRARGLGSAQPLAGLEPTDPANRRIEFSVIAPVSFEPTVIDTPTPEADGGMIATRVMPLWLEIQVLLGLTYAAGLIIGWGVWGRKLASE